jgi:hypothetical protein
MTVANDAGINHFFNRPLLLSKERAGYKYKGTEHKLSGN